MDQSNIPAKKIYVFIALALITQILFAVPIFGHESTGQTTLGFSAVYWGFIGFYVVATVFWLILIPTQSPLRSLIQWASQWPGRVLILTGAALIGVTLITSNTNVLTVTFLNWLWFTWVIITHAKMTPTYHQTLKAAVIIIIVLIPILLISAVGNRSVHPDESQWADRAAGIFYGGGVGTNLWIGFEDMKPIHPGLGWFPVIYGALLRYVSFSIETGRVWNFASGVVASVLLGTAAGLMYGRREGIVTGLFAATGGELLIKQQ